MIYPTAIKSYRYKDGASYSFDGTDGSVEILGGPLVMKSFSFCLSRPTSGDNVATVQFLDGLVEVFRMGLSNRLGHTSSVVRVNIPGAGMRFGTSLNMQVIDYSGVDDAVCSNINIGYQR